MAYWPLLAGGEGVAMTDDLRERMRRLFNDLPDWALPLFVDMLKRFKGGMPLPEVDRLFRQELPGARAAHENDVERLAGEARS